MVDATFDTSPNFLPHTAIGHRRFWVDAKELSVLREQRAFEGLNWTAEISFTSFHQPVSAETVAALREMASQPKERVWWTGKPLPNLALQQMSGGVMRFDKLRGKPVLLDFWGSYCGTCRATTRHAQELAERYRGSGLTVITLTQDDAGTAKLWATYNHLRLPVVLDKEDGLFRALQVDSLPVMILADREGKIVHYWTGYQEPASVDEALRKELETEGAAVALAE